jgi:hypothetical protein
MGHSQNGITAVSGMARPQGGQPAAIFYSLGCSTPYGPAILEAKSRHPYIVKAMLELKHQMIWDLGSMDAEAEAEAPEALEAVAFWWKRKWKRLTIFCFRFHSVLKLLFEFW